jgi:hypothetical protein
VTKSFASYSPPDAPYVERALALIAQASVPTRKIAYLVNPLELIERGSRSRYSTAAAFVAHHGPEHGRREKRVFQEGFLRLQGRCRAKREGARLRLE